MAFTTLSGSDGITSLVGTTGVDAATLVTLNNNVFVGGNTGNDTLVVNSGTGTANNSGYTVRMGGGDDGVVVQGNLLNSSISLDGLTAANGANDTLTADPGLTASTSGNVINTEILGLAGNDTITLSNTSGSTINGNAGNDVLISAGSTAAGINSAGLGTVVGSLAISSSSIFGGQGSDVIVIGAIGTGNVINGNRGGDIINFGGATVSATTLFGGQGSDSITLANANTIAGNTLSGDLGNDTLVGAQSDDILTGGDGADSLNGNGGSDTLTGGAGADIFVFQTGESLGLATARNGADSVADLVLSAGTADTIQVQRTGGGGGAGAAGVAAADLANVAASAVDLATNIAAAWTGGASQAQGIQLVAGGNGAAFAGNYIAVDIDNDGAFTAGTDTVFQVNSFNGLAATNITYIA